VRDAGYQRWDVPHALPRSTAWIRRDGGEARSELPWFRLLRRHHRHDHRVHPTNAHADELLEQHRPRLPEDIAETYPHQWFRRKPTDIWTLPAFFPVMFELTILFSAFTTLFGLLATHRPATPAIIRFSPPKLFAKFSDDGFFVCIEARDAKFSQEGTKAFLEKAGAQKPSNSWRTKI